MDPNAAITPQTHPELFEESPSRPAPSLPARALLVGSFEDAIRALEPPRAPLVDPETGEPLPSPFAALPEALTLDAHNLILAWRVVHTIRRGGNPDALPSNPLLRPNPTTHATAYSLGLVLQKNLNDPASPYWAVHDPLYAQGAGIMVRCALDRLQEAQPPSLTSWFPTPTQLQAFEDSWIEYAIRTGCATKIHLGTRLTQVIPDLGIREATYIAEDAIDQILSLSFLDDKQLREVLVHQALNEAEVSDKPIPALKLVAELRGLTKTDKAGSVQDLIAAMMGNLTHSPGPEPREIEATPATPSRPHPLSLRLPATRLEWPDDDE